MSDYEIARELNERRAEAAAVRESCPRGLRGLFERMAAALGNGDDLTDDRRGWLASRQAQSDGE